MIRKTLQLLVIISIMPLLAGCYGLFSPGSTADCEETANDEARDRCLMNQMFDTQDPKNCEQMTSWENKTNCYIEIAVITNVGDACDPLDGDQYEKCIITFSGQGLHNGINACKEQEDVDRCLIHRAQVKNNPLVCEAHSDYKACIEALLDNPFTDRSPCLNVPDRGRLECATAVAQLQEDPDVCDEYLVEPELTDCRNNAEDTLNKAAGVYAGLICMLNSESFWDDFWEDQTDAEIAAEEARMNAFYGSHGYDNEESAKKDLRKHWGTEDFKAETLRLASNSCSLSSETLDGISALLEGPLQE